MQKLASINITVSTQPPPTFFHLSLLIAGAFTFAYCFGVIIHEIGHVLAYWYYGISTTTLVLDPLGHSYMTPAIENPEGELLQRSGGTLFNVFCAILSASFFWKKKSLFALPILIWPASALIQESIAIILDVINGLPFDWAFVVASGIPIYMVLLLSIIFLISGCGVFLYLLSIAGISKSWPTPKIIASCLIAVTPFFIISLIYALFFLESDRDNWVLSKSIALGASILLSIIMAFMFKPSIYFLQTMLGTKPGTNSKQRLTLGPVILSNITALFIILFCGLFFN
ncbi:hypothetical protein [Aliikangiella maris]|uniref:Uncharacterized protein n=2 Tax=Aliikangiella maris TaxID=3162458 RepID=A0ABV3MT49_9GAMM